MRLGRSWLSIRHLALLFFVSVGWLAFSPDQACAQGSTTLGGSRPSAREALARADALRFAEEWYGAIEAYLVVVSINPSYGEAYRGLAECYYELEEYDQALSYAKKAAPFLSGDAALADLEAFIRIGLGDTKSARALFEAVIARLPNDLDARFGLALLDLASGKKSEARSRLEESLRLSPMNARALLSLSLIAQDQGRTEEARALLDRALRFHGQEPRVQYIAARLAAEAGDRAKAVFHARNALESKPAYAAPRRLLAALMYEATSYDEAIALMREAIARDRKDAASWFTLGLAQAASGRHGDAVYSLRTALGLKPDDELVRIALENLVTDGSPLEDPSREAYADWHFKRAAEFEDRSLFDQALFEYRRGLRLFPYSKKGRASYAELLRKRGYPAKQLAELQFLKGIGKADTSILDAIEIYASLLDERVGLTWGIDQYALQKRPYRVSLFYAPTPTEGAHTDGENLLARYLGDLLGPSTRLSLIGANQKAGKTGLSGTASSLRYETSVASSSEAFRRARDADADYYLLFSARETEREVELSAELRVARTGSLAASFRSFRTGNDRVKNTTVRLAELIVSALEPRGAVLKRSQDRAIVDLGASDGVKKGDTLLVLKKGSLGVLFEGLGSAYAATDVVGTLVITAADEEVAEGILSSSGFFDTINEGDEVIRAPGEKSKLSAPSVSGGVGQGAAGTAEKTVAPQAPLAPEPEWPGLFAAIQKLR